MPPSGALTVIDHGGTLIKGMMLLWNMQTMNVTASGFESLPAMNLRLRRPNESDAPALAGTTAMPDCQTLLAIERLADGVVVGAVGLSPQGTDRKAAQITYWVDEPFRRDGLATEAVRRVAVWVFQDLGLEILSAPLPKNHPAARRVLEKAGFTAVGEAFVLSRTAWLTQWAARPRVLVAAAEFAWRDGCCSGVDLGTIVAEATKGIKALDRCELLGLLTERSLILGDEPRGDRTLFALGGTSVLIFSANDSIPERIVRRTAALTEGVWNDLDAVLVTGGTLQPLVDLLR